MSTDKLVQSIYKVILGRGEVLTTGEIDKDLSSRKWCFNEASYSKKLLLLAALGGGQHQTYPNFANEETEAQNICSW